MSLNLLAPLIQYVFRTLQYRVGILYVLVEVVRNLNGVMVRFLNVHGVGVKLRIVWPALWGST